MKNLVCSCFLLLVLVTGCSGHANYVVSEPGYRNNDKLIGLLNAKPVDVADLYPDPKPVKLSKSTKPASPAVRSEMR